MSPQIPVIDLNYLKWALDLIGSIYRSWVKQGARKKADQLLSTVIRELLSLHPNITRAQAGMKALEITGAKPSPGLLWADNALLVARNRRRSRYEARENLPRAIKARRKSKKLRSKYRKRSVRVKVLS